MGSDNIQRVDYIKQALGHKLIAEKLLDDHAPGGMIQGKLRFSIACSLLSIAESLQILTQQVNTDPTITPKTRAM